MNSSIFLVRFNFLRKVQESPHLSIQKQDDLFRLQALVHRLLHLHLQCIFRDYLLCMPHVGCGEALPGTACLPRILKFVIGIPICIYSAAIIDLLSTDHELLIYLFHLNKIHKLPCP